MDYYLIEIETRLKVPREYDGISPEKIMYRLVKAVDEADAIKRAAESVNKINFEILDMESLTILPDEYNGL